MNVISTLKRTSTSELINTHQAIHMEIQRRNKLAESLCGTLRVIDLKIRVTTRSTLYRSYRELTQNALSNERELTIKELLLNLPPSYWKSFDEVSPKGYREFRTALAQKKINIQLFSTPLSQPQD